MASLFGTTIVQNTTVYSPHLPLPGLRPKSQKFGGRWRAWPESLSPFRTTVSPKPCAPQRERRPQSSLRRRRNAKPRATSHATRLAGNSREKERKSGREVGFLFHPLFSLLSLQRPKGKGDIRRVYHRKSGERPVLEAPTLSRRAESRAAGGATRPRRTISVTTMVPDGHRQRQRVTPTTTSTTN